MATDELREAFAEQAHAAWSGWMRHLFALSEAAGGDGSIAIPPALVWRWERQMETPYAQLSEQEKESDRKEADEYLDILERVTGIDYA